MFIRSSTHRLLGLGILAIVLFRGAPALAQPKSAKSNGPAQKLHPEVAKVATAIRAAADKNRGNVNFASLADQGVRGMDRIDSVLKQMGITVRDPQVDPSGSILLTASFRKQSLSVLLQTFPSQTLGVPHWAITVKFPTLSEDMVPGAVLKFIASQFNLAPPMLVVSSLPEDLELTTAQLTPAIRNFYGAQMDIDPTVTVKSGVRLTMKAGYRPGSAADKAVASLKKHKFEIDANILLEATLMPKIPSSAGEIKSIVSSRGMSLLEGLSIRATLPKFSIPLPKNGGSTKWLSSQAYLEVTAKPTIEVGFQLDVVPANDPSQIKSFLAKATLSADIKDGSVSVLFVAEVQGTWKNPLGLNGFNFHGATLMVGIDTGLNLSVGVRGKIGLQLTPTIEKKIDMAGALAINLTTGVPENVAMRCGSPTDPLSLNRDEVVLMVNRIIRMANPRAKTISSGKIPNFSLNGFYFSFALKEGYSDLKIEDGLALAGELSYDNKKLMAIDAKLNWSSDPQLKLKGSIADFQLSWLKVKNLNVDIALMAADVGNSYFKFSGAVDISQLNAIAKQASAEVKEAAGKANQKFYDAKAKVDAEQKKVDALDTQIRVEREKALKEYNSVKNAVRPLQDAVRSQQAIVADWQRKIDAEKSFFKRQPLIVKKKLAEGTLAAAQKALSLYKPAASWAVNAAGPDAHPTVAALITAKATATASLNVAKGVLDTARKATAGTLAVTEYALKADLFAVDAIAVQCDVQAAALLDSHLTLRVDYRYMGKNASTTLTLSAKEVKADVLVQHLKMKVGF